MGKTSIEWTDASWNPIVGCTEISPGCANCYAARLAATRLRNTPQYKGLATIDNPPASIGPRWTGEVRFLPERLEEPLHWREPRRIFVCDMGDLFHESVTEEALEKIWYVMLKAERHTFQVLTKRPQRMRSFVKNWRYTCGSRNFLPNVWLGVSVENQHFADERIPLLLQTPAAVRWISAEPLLGPVDLNNMHPPNYGSAFTHTFGWPRLDWVIAGGESGPHARPMHPDWARSLRDQCQAAGVPFFFKQWGEYLPGDQSNAHLEASMGRIGEFDRLGKKAAGRLLDGREWNEYPCAR